MKKAIFELDRFSERKGTALSVETDENAHLAHLERDRWPEFERELRLRKPRRYRYGIHHYGVECHSWEWLVWCCRTWDEVERVLNRHNVHWSRECGQIVMEGMSIFRR